MKVRSFTLRFQVSLVTLMATSGFGAFAAPGEDVIILKGPISYASTPMPESAKSEQLHQNTDIPAWMRARITRFTAKAYSATADDGSIITDNDVVTTTTSQGLRKTCVQEVGTTTTTSDSLGGRYGPGQKDQVVVLRGDLVNVCR